MPPATIFLVAGIVGAVGAISQGVAAQEAADFRAEVGRQDAVRAGEVAAAEEEDFRRAQSRTAAEGRAAFGGAGLRPGTGTALIAAGDFAAEVELNALRIRAGGEAARRSLLSQAELDEAAGEAAFTQGLFRGGASLLTGFSGFQEFQGVRPAKIPKTQSARAFSVSPPTSS